MLIPEKKIIGSAVNPNTEAEPKSGSIITKNAGIPAINNARMVVDSFDMTFLLSDKKRASAKIVVIFATSEG